MHTTMTSTTLNSPVASKAANGMFYQQHNSRKQHNTRKYTVSVTSQQNGPPPAWPGRAVIKEHSEKVKLPKVRLSWKSFPIMPRPCCGFKLCLLMGSQKFSLLGSTGSIGTQSLEIIEEHPEQFELVALGAGSNIDLLADQIKQFKPSLVALRDASKVKDLKELIKDVDKQPEIMTGQQGAIAVAEHPDADAVITGIVGCAGLQPTCAAIEAGKDICLANKETLIAGGPYVLPLAQKHSVHLLPAGRIGIPFKTCVHNVYFSSEVLFCCCIPSQIPCTIGT